MRRLPVTPLEAAGFPRGYLPGTGYVSGAGHPATRRNPALDAKLRAEIKDRYYTGRMSCPAVPGTVRRRRDPVLNVRDIREAELVTASGERILVREVNGKVTLAVPNHTDAKLTLVELKALGETLVQMANHGRESRDPLLERVKATEAEFFRSKGVQDPWAGYSGREFS